MGSIRPLRRAYYINKYVHETDAEKKLYIAVNGRLTESEKQISATYLRHYRAVPKRLALIPAMFFLIESSRVGFEGVRVTLGKFKGWISKK